MGNIRPNLFKNCFFLILLIEFSQNYLSTFSTIGYTIKGCYKSDDPTKQYDESLTIISLFGTTDIGNFSFVEPRLNYTCDPVDLSLESVSIQVYNEISESRSIFLPRNNDNPKISIDPKFKYPNDYDFYWKQAEVLATCINGVLSTNNPLITLNCTTGVLKLDQNTLIKEYELVVYYNPKMNVKSYKFKITIGNKPILTLESTNVTLYSKIERVINYNTDTLGVLPLITKNGQIFDDLMEISSKSIRFLYPKREHEGSYQITIINAFGTTTVDFTVPYVIQNSEIRTEYSNKVILKGHLLYVECQVIGHPILSVDITRNSIKLPLIKNVTESIVKYYYEKESTNYDDEGLYTCILQTLDLDTTKSAIFKALTKNVLEVKVHALPSILKQSITKTYRALVNSQINMVILFEGLPLPDIQMIKPNGDTFYQEVVLTKDQFNIHRATYSLNIDSSMYGNWIFSIYNKNDPIDFDTVNILLDRIARPSPPIDLSITTKNPMDQIRFEISWKDPLDNGGAPVLYIIEYCLTTISETIEKCQNISNVLTKMYFLDGFHESEYTFRVYAVNIAGISDPAILASYKTLPIDKKFINLVKSLSCNYDQENISVLWTIDYPNQSYEFNIYYCIENATIIKSCVKNLIKTKKTSFLLTKLDRNFDYSISVQPQIGSIIGLESQCFVSFRTQSSATKSPSKLGTGEIIGLVISGILIVLVVFVVICYTAFGKGPFTKIAVPKSGKSIDARIQYESLPSDQKSRVQPV